MKFWDKVHSCKHEWSGDYTDGGACGTPYCEWYEERCKKCGVYKVICDCGLMDGFSGWPEKRWNRFYRKRKYKK